MEGWPTVILRVEKLSCDVPGRRLFDNVSFGLDAGQAIAITGPSGSGKSTLVSTVLGLTTPAAGEVYVAEQPMTRASTKERLKLRRDHIGVVFQSGELMPELTAAQNVSLGAMLTGNRSDASARAIELLDRLGVPAHTRADDLSGGERQRTALARALASEPQLIIADEPTGSLDTVTRDEVADDLMGLVRDKGLALLVVTHDPTIARRADRVLELAHT